MRSTTPPTSRRTACAITPATWRWCARSVAGIPIVLASATPSVETEVNARRGRYAQLHLPERFGGQHLPAIEAIDLQARRPAARALHRAAARRGGEDRARARRAGAVVPQPPRLCAAHAVPRLRPPLRLPELRRLAGRSPLPPAAGLPPLRLRDAAAGASARNARRPKRSSPVGPGVERLEQEAAELFPDARILVLSSDLVDIDGAAARGARRRRARAASTSSSARSSSPRGTIFPSSIWSASSTPISASPTAIRAPPSARSSCCIRWSAAPAARRAAAIGYLQTHQPEHPVMRALIAQDREAFYADRDRAAREDAAIRRSGGWRAC